MAPQTPTLSSSKNIAGKSSGGGVAEGATNTVNVNTTGMYGAPLSSKQGKLAELRLELKDGQTKLEEAATPEQRMDLYMVEGITLVAKAADQSWTTQQHQQSDDVTKEFEKWILAQDSIDVLDKAMFENYLFCVSQKVDSLLLKIDENYRKQHQQQQSLYYSTLSEFLVDNPSEATTENKNNSNSSEIDYNTNSGMNTAQDFDTCCFKFRLLLVKAAIQQLNKNWDTLTTLTDADIDRAAVSRSAIERPSTLAKSKVTSAILAYTNGTCIDRMRALWSLMDHDNDDCLEQEEMANIVYMSMRPVEEALKVFFKESIHTSYNDTSLSTWRQRRAINLKRKRLEKLFQQTMKNHFDVEIEIAHRLRCVYAWANKAHQDGKIASTLVASSGSSFRSQRYVELNPKINFEEFREEQKSFIPQLDTVGEELMKGFKDDLLLQQGTGRQNKELKRDCFTFFVLVSFIDFALYYM